MKLETHRILQLVKWGGPLSRSHLSTELFAASRGSLSLSHAQNMTLLALADEEQTRHRTARGRPVAEVEPVCL
jgi:hypothetical protein